MVKYVLYREESVFVLTPDKPLDAKDFELLKNEIDPYVEQTGQLKGLMICAEGFPGWGTLRPFCPTCNSSGGIIRTLAKLQL